MPISPISATTAGLDTTSPAPAAPASQAMLDREAFLKLLVAQLRYQDPSKPIDSSEMIAQSAQLSVVDKLTEIGNALERSGASDRLALAGSIMGKQISFAGPDGMPLTATVDFVRFDGGSIVLGAGQYDVPYDAVLAVADAPAPATSPATTDPTPTDTTPTDTAPTDTQENPS